MSAVPPTKDLKIVFLTNKSVFGAEILRNFKQKNITVACILIEQPESGYFLQKLKGIVNRYGYLAAIEIVAEWLWRRLFPREPEPWRDNDFYAPFTDEILVVNDFNGHESEKKLRSLQPDIIVLGGSGVIRSNIIRIPSIGILNAHPGSLPKYRGVEVIAWAIWNEDPIGVTVHFLDAGVDTGPICARELLPLPQENCDLEDLRIRASKLAGKLMQRVVLELSERGTIETTKNPLEKGRQYYRMKRSQYREADKKLKQIVRTTIQ